MKVHQELIQIMENFRDKAQKAGMPSLQIPPTAVSEMKTEYTACVPGESLSAKFPFDPRFLNPVGTFQGGMIGTLFDNVYGPLGYMAVERLSVTTEMAVKFVRPFTAQDEFLIVKADVISKTKRFLLMDARAYTPQGKLVATSTTTCMIVD